MSIKTRSEELFEQFCRDHHIAVTPIPCEARQTADYRCQVSGREVIAEVKQLDPSPEDVAARAAQVAGVPGMRWFSGDRVRSAIKGARPQIKNSSKGLLPGLVILYNNVPTAPPHTDPLGVLGAMHGDPQFTVSFAPTGEPSEIKAWFTGGRTVARERGVWLSALCVLYENRQSGRLGLTFYHNRFAARPFDPEWLRGDDVRHYVTGDGESRQFQNWVGV